MKKCDYFGIQAAQDDRGLVCVLHMDGADGDVLTCSVKEAIEAMEGIANLVPYMNGGDDRRVTCVLYMGATNDANLAGILEKAIKAALAPGGQEGQGSLDTTMAEECVDDPSLAFGIASIVWDHARSAIKAILKAYGSVSCPARSRRLIKKLWKLDNEAYAQMERLRQSDRM